jgi:hypothetical protein
VRDAEDVPAIDLVDDTFVVASPEQVAAVVGDPQRWRAWWPDLQLTTTRDRGVKGVQWRVRGALEGTAEIWLEPWRDGVVVHYYLRCDPRDPATRPRRERRRRAQAWKRVVHGLKDALELAAEPPALAVKDASAAADVQQDDPEGDHRR